MGLRIARLQLGPPSVAAVEPIGDPISGVGGAVVPAPRVPQQVQLQLNTVVTGATTVAQAQMLRRQLRSLLNNSPLKFQGFLYIVYDDDTELNGWYVPDQSQIDSRDAASFIAGVWETAVIPFSLIGHQRTHREARQAWAKSLIGGLYQRDTLGWIYSTDFSLMTPLALMALPAGAANAFYNVQWQTVPLVPLPTGADGGTCQQTVGIPDLAVITYERSESNFNLGDVVMYDRRGQITAPNTQADTNWQEVYGDDWPWSWLPSGTADVPVLANGLVRVRYNNAHTIGFSVDLWNGSAYVEQGKMMVVRLGSTTAYDTAWVSAWVREWTPERAVVGIQLSNVAGDSGEVVFITMARGVIGATFEVYPATQANGTPADAQLRWSPALNGGSAYAEATLLKIDSQLGLAGNGQIADVLSGGDNQWPASANVLGAASFSSSENYLALLASTTGGSPAPAPYQTNFAVVQAAIQAADYGSDTNAYGVSDYVVQLGGTGATNLGYVQVSVAFSPTVSDQVNEAENIRNASGTTSQISDGNASNGLAVQDTQTAATNPTLSKASNLLQAKYRILVRVRAGTGGTASFKAALGATSSATETTTSTSYVWLDLGDVLAPSASPTFTVTAWNPTTSDDAVVDCYRAILVEDRTRSVAIYSGARDAGVAQLTDSRALGALTARG